MAGLVRRALGEPLLLFAACGALLFGAFGGLQARHAPRIELSIDTRDRLLEDFAAVTGRRPSAPEARDLEERFIADELLFREALANGLHLLDPVTRASLVEAMRRRITGVLPEPTAEALINFYADHQERYSAEPTVTFRHVFLRRAPAEAEAVLAALRAGEIPTGDVFPHGETFPAYGHSMLRGLFGQPFLESLAGAPLGSWQGPLRSLHGWHFLLVTAREPARRLPFAAVRNQVMNDWMQARIDRAVDRKLDELRARYAISIAG